MTTFHESLEWIYRFKKQRIKKICIIIILKKNTNRMNNENNENVNP